MCLGGEVRKCILFFKWGNLSISFFNWKKINLTCFKNISFHKIILMVLCKKLTWTIFALMWNHMTFSLVSIMQAITREMARPFLGTAAAPEGNRSIHGRPTKTTFNRMSEQIPVQHRHFFIHKIFITISIKVKKKKTNNSWNKWETLQIGLIINYIYNLFFISEVHERGAQYTQLPAHMGIWAGIKRYIHPLAVPQ